MKIFVSILFLFASIGVVNGLIAGFVLLLRRGHLSRKILGFLLIALGIRIGKSVFFYFSEDVDRLILQIGLSACVFIGPFYYNYVQSKLSSDFRITKKIAFGFFGLFFAIVLVGALFPYRTRPEIWNGIIVYAIYIIWATFVVLGLIQARFHVRKMVNDSGFSSLLNDEMSIISFAMVFITSTYMCALLISGFTYIWGAIAFTIFFYYMMILVLLGRKEMVVKKYSNELLEGGDVLLEKVNEVMSENRLFFNPKLKLDQLAEASHMDRNKLSRVLNEIHGGGFAQYVNEFRVKAAQRLIGERPDLSLEGIGFEAGFNSKSSFYSAFKKLTGVTPATYKKGKEKTPR